MDPLIDIEARLGKSRSVWQLKEWRAAALELAGLPPHEPGKRGRPEGEVIRGNIALLSFWADEKQQQGERNGQRITDEESIKQVIDDAARRENVTQGKADALLSSAVRRVRGFRQQKERK